MSQSLYIKLHVSSRAKGESDRLYRLYRNLSDRLFTCAHSPAPLVPTNLATATSPKCTASASVIGAALDMLLDFEAQGE